MPISHCQIGYEAVVLERIINLMSSFTKSDTSCWLSLLRALELLTETIICVSRITLVVQNVEWSRRSAEACRVRLTKPSRSRGNTLAAFFLTVVFVSITYYILQLCPARRTHSMLHLSH
jgi:uncharacterized membrane protein YidH (DUF202 family)